MKIVHIVESFASGVFDFIVDLSNGMSSYKHIIIYSLREHTPDNFKKYFPNETEFIHWNSATREINPKADIQALLELIKILKNIPDVDIIHLHSSKAGFLGRIAAKILKKENITVYTSHGAPFLRKDVSRLKQKLFIYLEKVASYFGGNIVCCSKSEAEAFLSHKIDALYINNGIECSSKTKNNINRNKDIIYVGTIGRISYQKNPELFNKIAEAFLPNKKVKFIWIGSGELESKLTSPNIIKTGWLKKKDVLSELSKIDIYLSTSIWEGLPLSVLQAMCYEKPLLLSCCVGNKDLVKNNYNGILFSTLKEAEDYSNIMKNNPEL